VQRLVQRCGFAPSWGGIGFESVDLRRLLGSVSACSPRGCQFSGKTSRNPQWRARACCLPCRPSRGNGCMFPRERKSNRWEDPGRESSGLRSARENGARCRGISAAAHCRWKRKLHTGKHVAVGRNVAGGVTGAARDTVHDVFARRGWRSTEFFHVAHQFLIMEDLLEIRPRNSQGDDGCISVHFGRDRGNRGCRELPDLSPAPSLRCCPRNCQP